MTPNRSPTLTASMFLLAGLTILLVAVCLAPQRPRVATEEPTVTPTLVVHVLPERSPVPAYTSTVQPPVQPAEAILTTPTVTRRHEATPTATPTPTETPRAERSPVQRGMR